MGTPFHVCLFTLVFKGVAHTLLAQCCVLGGMVKEGQVDAFVPSLEKEADALSVARGSWLRQCWLLVLMGASSRGSEAWLWHGCSRLCPLTSQSSCFLHTALWWFLSQVTCTQLVTTLPQDSTSSTFN